mmetsp:Transcript_23799/g.33302  ORF Transcript_23799/g.33302 Transcript_23799/m.33302 type:complete len:88 (-) Transcript_23799:191-454(-)
MSSYTEVQKAAGTMSCKAQGVDGMNALMLQCGGESLTKTLVSDFKPHCGKWEFHPWNQHKTKRSRSCLNALMEASACKEKLPILCAL